MICHTTSSASTMLAAIVPRIQRTDRPVRAIDHRLWTLTVFLHSLLLLPIITLHAQDTILNVSHHGKLDSIMSTILNQKRYIEVLLPSTYKPGSADKYDVLYVLDGGNWNTGLVARTHRFLEGEGMVPPTIIVSVTGIDRNKELTPTKLDNWLNSGGGNDFMNFIKSELIPHINKNYPSNGDNTLWGHSLSGMFAVYCMLNEPALFKSVIANDPSFWWDKNMIPKMAADKLSAFTDLNTTVYISAREGKSISEMKIDTMETVLKKHAPPGLNWKVVVYPGESHSSIRFKTTYDGLKFSYAGLTNDIEFHPTNGIVLKDKPIGIWYFADASKVHYTTDGSVPTLQSPLAQSEVNFTGGGKVTYKLFTQRSTYDKITTGYFTAGEALKPVNKPKNTRSGGLGYQYYEGDWTSWPDVKSLKPAKTGVSGKSNFETDKLPRNKDYALVVEGYLESKEEGYYIFLFNADKDARLHVGGKLLVQWDGDHQRRTNSYIVPMKKGFYPVRIEYLQKNEEFKLELGYVTPSGMATKSATPIPAEVLYNQSGQ